MSDNQFYFDDEQSEDKYARIKTIASMAFIVIFILGLLILIIFKFSHKDKKDIPIQTTINNATEADISVQETEPPIKVIVGTVQQEEKDIFNTNDNNTNNSSSGLNGVSTGSATPIETPSTNNTTQNNSGGNNNQSTTSNNNNNTDSSEEGLAPGGVDYDEYLENTSKNTAETILLDAVEKDITSILTVNNANVYKTKANGLEPYMITSIRQQCGQSKVVRCAQYKVDTDYPTSGIRGQYMLEFTIVNSGGKNKIVYVFLWTDNEDDKELVTSVDYSIGDR